MKINKSPVSRGITVVYYTGPIFYPTDILCHFRLASGGVYCVNTIREPTGSDERHLLDESVALYFFK